MSPIHARTRALSRFYGSSFPKNTWAPFSRCCDTSLTFPPHSLSTYISRIFDTTLSGPSPTPITTSHPEVSGHLPCHCVLRRSLRMALVLRYVGRHEYATNGRHSLYVNNRPAPFHHCCDHSDTLNSDHHDIYAEYCAARVCNHLYHISQEKQNFRCKDSWSTFQILSLRSGTNIIQKAREYSSCIGDLPELLQCQAGEVCRRRNILFSFTSSLETLWSCFNPRSSLSGRLNMVM